MAKVGVFFRYGYRQYPADCKRHNNGIGFGYRRQAGEYPQRRGGGFAGV